MKEIVGSLAFRDDLIVAESSALNRRRDFPGIQELPAAMTVVTLQVNR